MMIICDSKFKIIKQFNGTFDSEIQNVCLANGQLDMSRENLTKLTYLEACIKEALRLRIASIVRIFNLRISVILKYNATLS